MENQCHTRKTLLYQWIGRVSRKPVVEIYSLSARTNTQRSLQYIQLKLAPVVNVLQVSFIICRAKAHHKTGISQCLPK